MTRRAAVVLAVLVLAAGGVWFWHGYLAWRASAVAHALHRVPARRIGLCRCRADTTITVRRDGLRLAADVYGRAPEPRPTVLLLHGLTPRGAALPVYPVLATALADAGYLVVALDFAGFGRSDDPYALGATALDPRRDVRAALDAIDTLAGAAGPVVLLGHSMGAIEAMEVGLDDPRVGAVVAIGPPRRTGEVLATAAGRDYHWNRIRATYDSVYHRPMPAWFTRERFLALKAERDIERLAPGWQTTDHVPLLLLDGEREAAADREYLAAYAARLAGRSRHVTLADADHYLNSGSLGGLLYFDRAAVRAAVDAIVQASPDPRAR